MNHNEVEFHRQRADSAEGSLRHLTTTALDRSVHDTYRINELEKALSAYHRAFLEASQRLPSDDDLGDEGDEFKPVGAPLRANAVRLLWQAFRQGRLALGEERSKQLDAEWEEE